MALASIHLHLPTPPPLASLAPFRYGLFLHLLPHPAASSPPVQTFSPYSPSPLRLLASSPLFSTMAFTKKFGNIFKAVAPNPSIYQAIRCMSSSKVFVGGLSYSIDDQSLKEAFTDYGQVIEARVTVDRESGRSRGFGFVTLTSNDEASNAISGLDGKRGEAKL